MNFLSPIYVTFFESVTSVMLARSPLHQSVMPLNGDYFGALTLVEDIPDLVFEAEDLICKLLATFDKTLIEFMLFLLNPLGLTYYEFCEA